MVTILSRDTEYVFGINELDELLGSSLSPRSMVVIAGHPGSGKTTLASTICYSNTLRGHKCLYISLQEDREKLFNNMKKLGIYLEEQEKQNMLLFLRIPIARDVDEVVKTISEVVDSYSPRVIVVDSINALLTYVSDPDKRAWLQNYFYQLTLVVNGITIIVVEMPIDIERIDIGSIEFVADVVLILKSRIERKIISRYIEIRKARGSPIRISEIPFRIIEGKGLEVFIPPIPMKINRIGKFYNLKTPLFRDVVSSIPADGVILIVYPPDSRMYISMLFLAEPVLENNLKILVISFTEPPHVVEYFIESIVSRFGIDIDDVKNLISRHVVAIESINPYSMSSDEIIIHIVSSIDRYRPDIVVIHGLEILYPLIHGNIAKGFNDISNLVQALRSRGVLLIGLMAYIEEVYKILSSLCDIVIRFFYEIVNRSIENYVYVWKQNDFPRLYKVDFDTLLETLSEALKHIVTSYKINIK
ncbi:MAG: ATPase domain-containing protein [Ignisphaera sp.]